MKKMLPLILFLMVFVFMVVPHAEAAPAPRHVSLLLSDSSYKSENSFYAICLEGLNRAQRKYRKRITTSVYSLDDNADARQMVMDVAKSSDLVLVAGEPYEQYIKEAMAASPNARFIILDSEGTGQDGVTSVVFRDEEGAFLAGALAALMTKQELPKINADGVVGAVFGEKTGSTMRMEKGFKAGVWYIDKNINTLCSYTGSFTDVAAAESSAARMLVKGADVIFAAAGASSKGVIDLAAKNGKFWVIGVDGEQEEQNPECVLASVVKRMDYLILRIVDDYFENGFDGTRHTIGLADQAIDLSLWSRAAKHNIPVSIRKRLEEISDKVKKRLIIIK